jgi:hypothetical protein
LEGISAFSQCRHIRRIFTNLKLGSKPLGALINFGERLSITAFPGVYKPEGRENAVKGDRIGGSRQKITNRSKGERNTDYSSYTGKEKQDGFGQKNS